MAPIDWRTEASGVWWRYAHSRKRQTASHSHDDDDDDDDDDENKNRRREPAMRINAKNVALVLSLYTMAFSKAANAVHALNLKSV